MGVTFRIQRPGEGSCFKNKAGFGGSFVGGSLLTWKKSETRKITSQNVPMISLYDVDKNKGLC